MRKTYLLSTTSRGILGRMTLAERKTGRFMRAPDEHPGGDAGGAANNGGGNSGENSGGESGGNNT